ncbi:MAG: hypothetical protein ABTQ32_27945 [Myxococcaceae bacterium]
MTPIHQIAGKLTVQFEPSLKAVVDTWTSYFVTLDEFRDAVLVKGMGYAHPRGVQAWIVDSSRAKGAFSPECQAFIASDVFPSFAKHGVKYFITINSESAVTKMTVREYQSKAGPHGLKLVEVKNLSDALEWLRHELGLKRAA